MFSADRKEYSFTTFEDDDEHLRILDDKRLQPSKIKMKMPLSELLEFLVQDIEKSLDYYTIRRRELELERLKSPVTGMIDPLKRAWFELGEENKRT